MPILEGVYTCMCSDHPPELRGSPAVVHVLVCSAELSSTLLRLFCFWLRFLFVLASFRTSENSPFHLAIVHVVLRVH